MLPGMAIRKQQSYETSQYRRLREDVESIYVMRKIRWGKIHWGLRPEAKQLPIQVLACRNLSRALGSFDINVCGVAWTGAALQVWSPHALSGIRDGIMNVNEAALERQSAPELRRTLLRVRKYMAYGFRLASVNPLVAALHEHFGVECSEGTALCENFVAYFLDQSKPLSKQDRLHLETQNERAKLVRALLRIVRKNEVRLRKS